LNEVPDADEGAKFEAAGTYEDTFDDVGGTVAEMFIKGDVDITEELERVG
jgi:hypothetical protein